MSQVCTNCQNEKPDSEFLKTSSVCYACLKFVFNATNASVDEQVADNQNFWASIRNMRKSRLEKEEGSN